MQTRTQERESMMGALGCFLGGRGQRGLFAVRGASTAKHVGLGELDLVFPKPLESDLFKSVRFKRG